MAGSLKTYVITASQACNVCRRSLSLKDGTMADFQMSLLKRIEKLEKNIKILWFWVVFGPFWVVFMLFWLF